MFAWLVASWYNVTMYDELMIPKEEQKPVSAISVRQMVEFLLRSGDIDRRVQHGPDIDAMQKGAVLHRRLQKAQGPEYTAEVPLKISVFYDELTLRIEGRADGVIRRAEGTMESGADEPSVVVDEIKGMYLDVTRLEEPFEVHLAQAKCYAAIIADKEQLPRIGVRMTYANLDTEDVRYFHYIFENEDLHDWFISLTDEWYLWAKWQLNHLRERNLSIENLSFPFPFREGQQHLAASVYHTIREKKQLFLMAPTGVGKTMSCVYPSVKALGNGLAERIFYLTAKNETQEVGWEAFTILKNKGLLIRCVRITAKEKICPLNESSCNPDDCPYAKGHFDRINRLLFKLLNEGNFYGREQIALAAKEGNVCPYELSLDLASFCDAIVCDYNYVFDPDAQLKRFFAAGKSGQYLFLIDEAHNLADRARDMYSASIVKEDLLKAKRLLAKKKENADEERLRVKLVRAIDAANRQMLLLSHRLDDEPDGRVLDSPYLFPDSAEQDKIVRAALKISTCMTEFFEESKDGALKEKLLEYYFALLTFANTAELLDENYTVYAAKNEDEHLELKLFCSNPASRLQDCLTKGRSAVFFSATLLPLPYFRKMLTTAKDPYAVYAKTPFDPEHRLLLAASDVSTVFKRRGPEMYRRIAAYLKCAAENWPGNYLVFFPSYTLMREVYKIYREEFDTPGINYVCQSSGMAEDDREIFLENFYENPHDSLLAFSVMGGMFSEGIDLTGTRLIGAIIVGAGLPQVSIERELLKQFYDRTDDAGFDYAYRYPGMNKVEQAAGRVIRTEHDRGLILLLDDRLLTSSYRKLYPREWQDLKSCTLESLKGQILTFKDNLCKNI